jgi:tRNA nucleotidyltransferase (CCA-adding enzyme)
VPHSDVSTAFSDLLAQPAVHALRAAAAGVETHLVGGVLRDRALGFACHDYDAVVARDGLAIARRLAEALPARLVLLGGKEFAAYRLVGAEDSIDLWDREGTSFEADLARRDFTINALALDVEGGELVDRFDGLGDLRRRLLRAVGPASFTGDPLRVLRLARLSLKLPGFAPEPATLDLAKASSSDLPQVAAERIREELGLLLAHPEAAYGLALLRDLDLYPGLWLGSPGVPGDGSQAVVEFEALTICARRLPPGPYPPELRLARLAATFRHLPAGTPPTARLERFRDAGYLSPREAQAVKALLEEEELPAGRVEQRRFFHRLGGLWSTGALSLAAREGATGAPEPALRWLDELAERAQREAEEAIAPPRLVSGDDVRELFGIAPGPQVGELLRAVVEAQVDGEVTAREEALDLVRSRLAAREGRAGSHG